MRYSPQSRAIVALVFGASAIAFAPIFVRISDISPTASAFWRMALAVIPLWLWVLAERKKVLHPAPLPWKPLVLAGFFFAGDLAVWHLSISFTSVANATLELNLAPIFVTLGAWFLFGHRVSPLFLFALAVTLTGASFLIGPNVGSSGKALVGDGLGILAGLSYACYMLTIKSAVKTVSTARIMAANTTVAAIILAPYALFTADVFLPQSANGWLVLCGLAIFVHVLGQSLIAYGFAHLSASFSSASLLLQPVMAAVYAWVLLGEQMGALQITGGLVVLSGIYLAKRAS